MRRALVSLLIAVAAGLLWTGPGRSLTGPGPAAAGATAPEFPTPRPDSWINSSPLTMASLRGQVVLLDVWTFG